jgi:hypothetical protein
MAPAGYKAEVAEMKNNFKLKYQRKSAFIDELNKVGVWSL